MEHTLPSMFSIFVEFVFSTNKTTQKKGKGKLKEKRKWKNECINDDRTL